MGGLLGEQIFDLATAGAGKSTKAFKAVEKGTSKAIKATTKGLNKIKEGSMKMSKDFAKGYKSTKGGTYLGTGGGGAQGFLDKVEGGVRNAINSRRNGQINYGKLDSLDRPTGIKATVTEDMIGTGTSARNSIEPPGWSGDGKANNQARGHLLAKDLGGSGSETRNLVTLAQNPSNTPIMSGYERLVKNAVRNDGGVIYSVKPKYVGEELIPRGLTINAKGRNGFISGRVASTEEMIVSGPFSILNPAARQQ